MKVAEAVLDLLQPGEPWSEGALDVHNIVGGHRTRDQKQVETRSLNQ